MEQKFKVGDRVSLNHIYGHGTGTIVQVSRQIPVTEHSIIYSVQFDSGHHNFFAETDLTEEAPNVR